MDIFNKFIPINLHLLIGLAPINQVLLENFMFFYKLTQKKRGTRPKTISNDVRLFFVLKILRPMYGRSNQYRRHIVSEAE
jgi:hypothetical protein